MKILVTGGAGFVGSALCRHLIRETHFGVVNVDKLTYAGNRKSLSEIERDPRYVFHRADICDIHAIRSILASEEPDAIINLAAETHVDRSITGPEAFIETNVVGTFRLLEAARRYWLSLPQVRRNAFRFLHVSTDEVYGSLGREGVFNEETPYDPSSPYSASKAASDHLVTAWRRTYGMPMLISNCSNNFGEYHFPEKFIPLAITNALMGRRIPVYGDGEQVRDWLYVEDHVRALLTIVTCGEPGERYNVGARSALTNISVVHAICKFLDDVCPRPYGRSHESLIEFVTDRPGHDRRYAINPSKIERELGWRPRADFESNLAKTILWYIDNEKWWRSIRETGYDGERLGLNSPSPISVLANELNVMA